VGNRLSSLGLSPYQYDNSNHLTSTPLASFAYDQNGNTTAKTDASGTTTYTWDYENRLVSVSPPSSGTVNFTYDPFGRRIRKSSATSTTIYAYDGDNVVEELDAAGNPTVRYAQGLGIDEPLAMYRGGVASYYHADGLGSVTSLTDSSGVVAASYVYDSFGNLTVSTGTITNPFRYTGREWDSETGLYYYRARYYDPGVGRFIIQDPVGFQGGINFYAYVRNRPNDWGDPMGLWSPVVHDAMIEAALTPCGVCRSTVDAIKLWSREFDDETGTDPRYANYHAMAKPGQTTDQAVRGIALAMELPLDVSNLSYVAGDMSLALKNFATSIHTMMDYTSPAHVQNGVPIGWCGKRGCSGNRLNVIRHIPIEPLGGETMDDYLRNPTAQRDAINMIRAAYLVMTGGSNLACMKGR
jgi:RHS repeat-associated protein